MPTETSVFMLDGKILLTPDGKIATDGDCCFCCAALGDNLTVAVSGVSLTGCNPTDSVSYHGVRMTSNNINGFFVAPGNYTDGWVLNTGGESKLSYYSDESCSDLLFEIDGDYSMTIFCGDPASISIEILLRWGIAAIGQGFAVLLKGTGSLPGAITLVVNTTDFVGPYELLPLVTNGTATVVP